MFGSTFTSVALAALALGTRLAQAAPTDQSVYKRDLKFDYNSQKVRGVNLGGWFVLEPWITPSMFDNTNGAVDEYTLCKNLGADAAYSKLSAHWNSWIVEDDFKQIAAAGLNHVRIPIGYWAVQKHPQEQAYVQGAYDVLGKALDWANNAGLKVMIDLHGAPFSQNGFDNSGQLGAVNWGTGDSIDFTKTVLNKIRDDHASHPAVATIELLNEPMASSIQGQKATVKQFYMDGWGNLKDSNVAITFHDAFQGVTNWGDFGAGMWNLMLDTHHYEVFDHGQLQMSPEDHIATACDFGKQMASTGKWTIAGEFTGGITDCAYWLNGLGKGSRYDGTLDGNTYIGSCQGKSQGTVANLSSADKYNIQRFIEAQLDAYEHASGWIFWTWKTQGAPEWDMKDLLANQIFPQPLTARKYPNQCGY